MSGRSAIQTLGDTALDIFTVFNTTDSAAAESIRNLAAIPLSLGVNCGTPPLN
ncbi:MAG: hypothetical protein HZA90_21940 [Verrucomicrobia bacterium]|nr:hypothetical protein [Verrucomicrobiota bacterium]